MEKKGGGAEERGRGESGGDRFKRRDVDGGVRGRVREDKLADLVTAVFNSYLKVHVLNNRLIHSRACVLEEGSQSSVFEVAVSPEIHCGSVAVVPNELAVDNGDRGQVEVVGTRAQKRGADRQKRDIDSPGVFEGRADREKEREADESVVGVGTPVEGSNQLGNQGLERFVELLREDEEKEVVGEERHNESVDKENAGEDGEVLDDRTGSLDPSNRFLVGPFKDVREVNFPTHHNTEVSGRPAKWEIRPRATEKLGAQGVISRAGGRGNDATFVFVYTEARESGEA